VAFVTETSVQGVDNPIRDKKPDFTETLPFMFFAGTATGFQRLSEQGYDLKRTSLTIQTTSANATLASIATASASQ
jgi:hypothetical protein